MRTSAQINAPIPLRSCNVVSNFSVGSGVPLSHISLSLQAKFGPAFPALSSKGRVSLAAAPVEPQTLYPLVKPVTLKRPWEASHTVTATNLQFASGQDIATGGRSLGCNLLMAYMYIRRVNADLRLHARVMNLRTSNHVFTGDVGVALNLDWLSKDIESRNDPTITAAYSPEDFCGCTVRLQNPEMTLVGFPAGKALVVGIRDPSSKALAEQRVADIFRPFAASRPVPADMIAFRRAAPSSKGKGKRAKKRKIAEEVTLLQPRPKRNAELRDSILLHKQWMGAMKRAVVLPL